MMRILYYIPYISKENGGLYQYSIALLKILVKDRTNMYFILNLNKNEDVVSIINGKDNFQLLTNKDGISLDKWGSYFNRLKKSLAIRIKKLSKVITYHSYFDKLLERFKIDIVHCPYQDLPESKIPSICTLHDVQELHFPGFFSSAERARRAVHYKNIIDKASKVVVSYNHIKNDIVTFFDKPDREVHTILLDMENLWIDRYISQPIDLLPGLPEKFLLYPAATWHHKNHLNLIKAVYLLKKEKNLSVKVVCTGSKTAHYKTLEQYLAEYDLSENFVFLGIVNDASLYSLYNQAYGVIVPTLYEAGSFPLMESILLGRPVICSNVTSLPETIGCSDFTFNPHNPAEIAKMVERFWSDEEFYRMNIDMVRKGGGTLRNNHALPKFLDLYSSIQSC